MSPDEHEALKTTAISDVSGTPANSLVHRVPDPMNHGTVPPEIETFLEDVADSFVKIELIKFFRRNQRLLGAIEDIAVSIGRDKKTTAKAIPHLLSAGVIKATRSGGAALWSYDPDPEMTQRIDAFLAFYTTERGRRAVVHRVLEGEV